MVASSNFWMMAYNWSVSSFSDFIFFLMASMVGVEKNSARS